MSFFVEQGNDEHVVREYIRKKYGSRAQILATKEISSGGFFGLFAKRRVELTGYIKRESPGQNAEGTQDTQNKILLQNNARADLLIQSVLEEVRGLKEKIDSKTAQPPVQFSVQKQHQSLEHIETLLLNNEFSPEYVENILQKLSLEYSLKALDNIQEVERSVITWIARSLQFHQPISDSRKKLCILVGPTGVGKTTTIAKLAALHGVIGKKEKKVHIITFDSYRIGAREQIAIYGDIMNIPVAAVESQEEFSKELVKSKDADIIFVDTIGRSPLDCVKIAEMHEFLKGKLREATVFLCVSATTKFSDLAEIGRQFDGFGPESVILTKLDETHCVGNVISALCKQGHPLSYLSTGQKVPQDIEEASLKAFLARLEGFSIQQDEILTILEMSE